MEERWTLLVHEQAPAAPVGGASHDAERWQVRGVPDPTALDEWSDVLATTHLQFDVSSTAHTPEDFSAAVTRRRFGGLALVDCASSPWLGHRRETCGRPHDAGRRLPGAAQGRRGGPRPRPRAGRAAPRRHDHLERLQPVEVEVVEPFHEAHADLPARPGPGGLPALGGDRGPAAAEGQRAGPPARPLPQRARPRAALSSTPRPAPPPPTRRWSSCAPRSSPACPPSREARARRAARRDPPLRALAPAGPGARARVDRAGPRHLGARAARAVRGLRRVGRRPRAPRAPGPLPGGPAGAHRRVRSPRSPSAGASATPPTSRACSSASSGVTPSDCAKRRPPPHA